MKKYTLLFFFTVATVMVFAQKGKVFMADGLLTGEKPDPKKAAELIKVAEAHAKSSQWPFTYIVKAKTYGKLFEESKNTDQAFISFDALKKANEYDVKGNEKGKGKLKYRNEIILLSQSVRTSLLNSGIKGFNTKNYPLAYKSFTEVLAFDSLDFNVKPEKGFTVDTSIVFNASLAAYYSNDFINTEKLVTQVRALNYGDKDTKLNIYRILYQIYKEELKDNDKLISLLKDAIVEFPEVGEFLNNLVLIYVKQNNSTEALKYLDDALARDPEKSVFWFAKGTYLDQNGDEDGAIKAYKRALATTKDDLDIFNANYNMGVIFFNQAVDQMTIAQDEQNYTKFIAKEKEALKAFKDVAPYFEKCNELQPNEMSVLETLSQLYYRLIKTDNAYQNKYKTVKEKMASLKN